MFLCAIFYVIFTNIAQQQPVSDENLAQPHNAVLPPPPPGRFRRWVTWLLVCPREPLSALLIVITCYADSFLHECLNFRTLYLVFIPQLPLLLLVSSYNTDFPTHFLNTTLIGDSLSCFVLMEYLIICTNLNSLQNVNMSCSLIQVKRMFLLFSRSAVSSKQVPLHSLSQLLCNAKSNSFVKFTFLLITMIDFQGDFDTFHLFS